jgi:hypothetical protein
MQPKRCAASSENKSTKGRLSMQKNIAFLLGPIFAAGIMAAGMLSATPAFADSCQGLREPRLHDCLVRKAYEQHNLNARHARECDRGGCGEKARKIQSQANRKSHEFEANPN